MKKILMLIVVLICSACSRQNTFEDPYASGFYFTNSKGTLYEYGDTVTKINTDGTKFVGQSNTIALSNTNEKAINIINKKGHIVFRHEPEKSIVSAALNKAGTLIYYATKDGNIYKYNRSTNQTLKYDVNVYPLPKQMILDEQQSRIIYHTNTNVYTFSLNNNKVEKLMSVSMAIKSIAYHKQSKTIYVSSSVHGKIYKINTKTKKRTFIHNPLSVAGTSICFNSEGTVLYFSSSNGRDVTISAIDMETGVIEVAYVLSNMIFLNDFVIKDE